jgi:hypothetical protein
MSDPRSRGVLDAPPEPVIGLAEGETRWRGIDDGRHASRGDSRRFALLLFEIRIGNVERA